MIRELLKAKTAQMHDEVEGKFDFLLDPNLTLNDYLSVLKKFYQLHLYFENNLKNDPVSQDYKNNRRKLQWLEKDIFNLTQDKSFVGIQTQKDFFFKDFDDEAALLGAIYVLEGSTLGGQVITSKLKAHKDSKIQNATRYYSGYQQNTGKMWRDFLTTLAERSWNTQSQERALSGAEAIFKEIGRS